jgi:hypothetical protein
VSHKLNFLVPIIKRDGETMTYLFCVNIIDFNEKKSISISWLCTSFALRVFSGSELF